MRARIGLLLSTLLTGCAGSASSAPPAAEAAAPACQHQLGPRSAPGVQTESPPRVTAPSSRLIIEARLPLARLASELERNVAPRLAEGSGVSLGPAGVLGYRVDRGDFSLSIADGQLMVETQIYGRAEACSGRRCYARCEPRAVARAQVPLWLRPDYRFARSRVSLQFTRGCKVRALGGLLSVDLTPLLKSRVAPQLERTRREIDSRLPDVRTDVERAWRQLSRPRPLPLGGCVVTEPLGFVQGPMQQSGAMAQARFALLARPELRTDCSGASGARVPLPPLSADPGLPEQGTVTLGMEVALASLARAFETASMEPGSGTRFRVAEASIERAGGGIGAELTLTGDVCGTVALQAQPAFRGEEGVIALEAGRLEPGESERVRAAGVDPAALARELTLLPRLPAPLSVPMLRVVAPALESLFSDPEFSLSARLSRIGAAGAAVRDQSVVAWMEARGSLLLEQK